MDNFYVTRFSTDIFGACLHRKVLVIGQDRALRNIGRAIFKDEDDEAKTRRIRKVYYGTIDRKRVAAEFSLREREVVSNPASYFLQTFLARRSKPRGSITII